MCFNSCARANACTQTTSLGSASIDKRFHSPIEDRQTRPTRFQSCIVRMPVDGYVQKPTGYVLSLSALDTTTIASTHKIDGRDGIRAS